MYQLNANYFLFHYISHRCTLVYSFLFFFLQLCNSYLIFPLIYVLNKNRNTNNETYNYIKYLHRKSFDLFFNITKPVSDAHPKISAIELNVNVNPRKNLKSIRDFNCPQSQKKTKLFFSLHNVALTRLWSYFYCTIVSYYCHLFSNPFPVVTKHVTTGCVQLTYSKIIFPYTKIKSFFVVFCTKEILVSITGRKICCK